MIQFVICLFSIMLLFATFLANKPKSSISENHNLAPFAVASPIAAFVPAARKVRVITFLQLKNYVNRKKHIPVQFSEMFLAHQKNRLLSKTA